MLSTGKQLNSSQSLCFLGTVPTGVSWHHPAVVAHGGCHSAGDGHQGWQRTPGSARSRWHRDKTALCSWRQGWGVGDQWMSLCLFTPRFPQRAWEALRASVPPPSVMATGEALLALDHIKAIANAISFPQG